MLKLWGAALTAIGCVALGVRRGQDLKQGVDTLNQLLQGLALLEHELRLQEASLPVLMERLRDRSHGAAGPLVDGYAVCDGYSKAFDLLCYLSGIDCIRVSGTSTNSSGSSGGHAWNKVKVDGTWYNVDVTWDDPVSSRPILRYDYFLVSDSTLARNHQWTVYSYLPAAERDYGK